MIKPVFKLSQIYSKNIMTDDRCGLAVENRLYYEENLPVLFSNVADPDEVPSTPSGLCAAIVDTLLTQVYPEGMTLTISNDKLEKALKEIEQSTGILDKSENIGLAGFLSGTAGLKSIWDKEAGTWGLDIFTSEHLIIEHDELNPEAIQSIIIRFRFMKAVKQYGKEEEFWWQEKWTATDYTEWFPERVQEGKEPEFPEDAINQKASTAHKYGEIPITLIQHKLVGNSAYGEPELTRKLKLYDRELTISLSKVGVASQLISTPAYKRINDTVKDDRKLKPATVLDLHSDGQHQTDFLPIEHPATAESVFEHQNRLKALAYESAQVTNPDLEKDMKAGGTISSVAWKAFNYKFIKKVNRLRVRYGDKGIESHLEKILRMAQALGLISELKPDDITTYEVQIDYPPFFEPTSEEKMQEIGMIRAAGLPVDTEVRMIATVLGIRKEDVILEMIKEAQAKRDMEAEQMSRMIQAQKVKI